MVEIGKVNTLKLVKRGAQGGHLDGGALGEILLPQRELPLDYQPGDAVEVFIYRNDKGKLIATTTQPYAMAGQYAFLKVTGLHAAGAFLDWGLPKDLLVPLREQNRRMVAGRSYVVHVYLDPKKGRIMASTKLDKFIDSGPCFYDDGQAVDLLVYDRTEIGYKAIINDTFGGMLFFSEVFQPLEIGQRLAGFIKQVRDDGKIDLCLHLPGYAKIRKTAIIARLSTPDSSLRICSNVGMLALNSANFPRPFGRSIVRQRIPQAARYSWGRFYPRDTGVICLLSRPSFLIS